MRATRVRRYLSLAFTAAVLAGGWYFLAPPALGGGTSYVFTDGVSMLPRFHSGDLAVVRADSSYRVGEVVAYHNRMLGTIVLHRIVAIHGGRYVLEGDNNDFLDPEHPLRSQLVGRLWLHVPRAYDYLSRVRSPLAVAVLAAVSTLLSLGGVARRRRRRRRRGDRQPPPVRVPAAVSELLAAAAAAAVPAAAALLAISLAVAALAYARPTATSSATAIPYTQSGVFSYSARTRPSVAYPDGAVRNGEPVFLKLTRSLDVRFSYRFASRTPARVAGTIALSARLASGSGWSRTFSLAPVRRFDGGRATAAGTLDVGRLPALLASLEHETAVTDQYALTVSALVRVRGGVGTTPLVARFAPSLPFTIDQMALRPPPAQGGNVFRPSASSSLRHAELAAATVALHGFNARVGVLRGGAAATALGSLAALLLASGTVLARSRRRDEPARIKARYGALIVDVARDEGDAIEVRDMEALARLADQFERPILHGAGAEGRDEFSVSDDGLRYLYRPPLPAPEPSPEPAVAAAEPEELTVQEWMDRLGLTAAAVMPPPRRRPRAA